MTDQRRYTSEVSEYSMTLYRVYLGRSIPGGALVEDIEFSRFIHENVNSRLGCYTMYEARGSWESETEGTSILEYLSLSTITYTDIMEIALEYKKLFNQDSVMVTSQGVTAHFI